LFDALPGSPRFFFENTIVKCTFQQTIWKKIRVPTIFFSPSNAILKLFGRVIIFNEYRDRVRNLIMGKDPYWILILLCRVNTNKKIQKSTGYIYIFIYIYIYRVTRRSIARTVRRCWFSYKTKNVVPARWCSATFCTNNTWFSK